MQLVREKVICDVGDEFSQVRHLKKLAGDFDQYGFPVRFDGHCSFFVDFPGEVVQFYHSDGCIMKRVLLDENR